ncbi:MAG: flavodoxin family protein [Megasphaera sp.]|uniref:flavodoxin family protein n=1 Tax=Megasphaera sp. TaxID=2023260 RepID=UPI003F08A46F
MNHILFINGSPNKNGNTASLAKTLLKGKSYDTLDLVDLKIYSYGQHFDDDQYQEVIRAISSHDVIVIGSPMYWHSMSGAIRNVLDRAYGIVSNGQFQGKKLFFLFQGAAPTQEQLAAGEYTMSRFAAMYGLEYQGMASSKLEAEMLAAKL